MMAEGLPEPIGLFRLELLESEDGQGHRLAYVAVGHDHPPLEYGGRYGGRSRVRTDDVAGSIKADRQNLRMQELDLLFTTPHWDGGAR